MSARPLHIVLAEDTAGDALLTRLALDASHVPYVLTTLHRGSDLLAYLVAHKPDLVLLDLGLPDIDGFAFLETLSKASPSMRSIPIVILTGYPDFGYIRDSHPLNIIAYLNKPCDHALFTKLLSRIEREAAIAV